MKPRTEHRFKGLLILASVISNIAIVSGKGVYQEGGHFSESFKFPQLTCNQSLAIKSLGTCTCGYLHHMTQVCSLYKGQSCIIPKHKDFTYESAEDNHLQISYQNETVRTKPANSETCDPHFDTTNVHDKQGVILNMDTSVAGPYKLSAVTPSRTDPDEADLMVYMVPMEATVQTSAYVPLNIGGETMLPILYGKEKRQMQCKKGEDLRSNTTVDLVTLHFGGASGEIRNETGRFVINDSAVIIKNTIPSDAGIYFIGVYPLQGSGTLWSTTILLNKELLDEPSTQAKDPRDAVTVTEQRHPKLKGTSTIQPEMTTTPSMPARDQRDTTRNVLIVFVVLLLILVIALCIKVARMSKD